MKTANIIFLSAVFLPVAMAWAQAIQSNSAFSYPGLAEIEVKEVLPGSSQKQLSSGSVTLLPGLFKDRRDLTKGYLGRLSTRNLLQNHLLEAGVRIDDASERLHQGWEAPHYQLRGHFLGHWMSAAAHFGKTDNDAVLMARAGEVVNDLERCQHLNGGQWVGSIPEKYFGMLEDGKAVWSPQYTVHKTLMGLLDVYRYLGNPRALEVLEKSSVWFDRWTSRLIDEGNGEVIYSGECAGMLELWADLYGLTGDKRYLELSRRYGMPDLFKGLLEGEDPLSNDHTNASIPWIQGAARLYEVTGDERYRQIVVLFWKKAVEERGMYATTGNNAGEFWVPPHQFGRFLGNRTQEHCTVYNMIRVADYLYRWTGYSGYADYIERALYNGILAQQNPQTGLVAYFLPLEPGSRKGWGSETKDFWCCHGTLVQAQAMFEALIYYRTEDGLSISQFIPSRAEWEIGGKQVIVSQKLDTSGSRSNFESEDDTTSWVVTLDIESQATDSWVLRVRQPWWAIDVGTVCLDGQLVDTPLSDNGHLELGIAGANKRVVISFRKRVVEEPLPGDPSRLALLDGPVVLAARSNEEPVICDGLYMHPRYEHIYKDGRDWQSEHYLLSTKTGTVAIAPLYEIVDEPYSVYMRKSPSND